MRALAHNPLAQDLIRGQQAIELEQRQAAMIRAAHQATEDRGWLDREHGRLGAWLLRRMRKPLSYFARSLIATAYQRQVIDDQQLLALRGIIDRRLDLYPAE